MDNLKLNLAKMVRGHKKLLPRLIDENQKVIDLGDAFDFGSKIAGERELLHALGGSTESINEDPSHD